MLLNHNEVARSFFEVYIAGLLLFFSFLFSLVIGEGKERERKGKERKERKGLPYPSSRYLTGITLRCKLRHTTYPFSQLGVLRSASLLVDASFNVRELGG